MDVIKMGKFVPGVRIKPTSLAFRASVLPFHHIGSLMSPPHTHLSMQLLALEVSADYYTSNPIPPQSADTSLQCYPTSAPHTLTNKVWHVSLNHISGLMQCATTKP